MGTDWTGGLDRAVLGVSLGLLHLLFLALYSSQASTYSFNARSVYRVRTIISGSGAYSLCRVSSCIMFQSGETRGDMLTPSECC